LPLGLNPALGVNLGGYQENYIGKTLILFRCHLGKINIIIISNRYIQVRDLHIKCLKTLERKKGNWKERKNGIDDEKEVIPA
jgi:hypothetical protein